MNVYRTLDDAAAASANAAPVITIGNFDGVHRGHQAILRDLVTWARKLDAPAMVMTFANHPDALLKGRTPRLITSVPHRLLLFERLGIDAVLVVPFDTALRSLPAEDFVRDVICGRLRARGLQLGYDSRFGRGAEGTPALAEQIGKRCGLEVRTSKPVVAADGKPISSTRIRERIAQCDFDTAAELLGRFPSIYGPVVEGAHLGRKLGYPTANLEVGAEVRPPIGVYATTTRLNGDTYGSMTNVGRRPTITDSEASPVIIETHLFGFSGDLYGREIEVEFICKLRDEEHFHNVDELMAQMAADRDAAIECLGARAGRSTSRR